MGTYPTPYPTTYPTPYPTSNPTPAPTGSCPVTCEVDKGQFKKMTVYGYKKFHATGIYHGTDPNHKGCNTHTNKSKRNNKMGCDFNNKRGHRIVYPQHAHHSYHRICHKAPLFC